MRNNIIIPEGFKDYIGEDKRIKEFIEYQTKKLFITAGYELIETPTLEYIENSTDMYTLINRQGEILALRSDMTESIARVVRSNKFDYPKRFCYCANVFRYPKRYEGKLHEFSQAGVELIGIDSLKADFEIISLAIETIKQTSTQVFSIHIGSSEFFEGIMEEIDNDELPNIIKEATQKNDVAFLKKKISTLSLTEKKKNLILKLLFAIGGLDMVETIKKEVTSNKAIASLEYLEKIYKALNPNDLANVLFDISLISHQSYYTGIRFEGYIKGIGNSILSGGRYNGLIDNVPAIGFGVNISDLTRKTELVNETVKYVYFSNEPFDKQRKKVNEYQNAGKSVELSLFDTLSETKEYAKKTNKEVLEG